MKIIGLDVGTKRIGVAKADTGVKIAVPAGMVAVDGSEFAEIARLARVQGTNFFVVGLPRSNEGNETMQSEYVRRFVERLRQEIPEAKVRFQDESLTSVEAEGWLRQRGRRLVKGEIDAEAAAIILQDFIENFKDNNNENLEKGKEEAVKYKKSRNWGKVAGVAGAIVVALGAAAGGGVWWYNDSLGAKCAESCAEINFKVDEGDTPAAVAKELERAGLIKNSWAFELHARMAGEATQFQVGEYLFNPGMSAREISTKLARGETDENVFSFTLVPGTTIMKLEKNLVAAGYSQAEVSQALAKNYNNPVLKDKPLEVSLEGYLYPETYEFYKDAPAEEVIGRMIEEMEKVVKENNLEAKFAAQGLSLHEGLTLASIVENEAARGEHANVARVFLNRLENGIVLGSDVTVQYALDLIDPSREIYSDNAAALQIDSAYNTRQNAGLPPGPISSISLESLLGVAEPAENDYFYFLTGDDGLMYYSSTEAEHLQKAAEYCKELCAVSL